MSPKFTDQEFLNWVQTKDHNETFDAIDNYTCPIAQFLNDTGRAGKAFVLSEDWYDEAIPLKPKKKPIKHPLPPKSFRACMVLHPANTFGHVMVRLGLLLEKRDMNDYYFLMKDPA